MSLRARYVVAISAITLVTLGGAFTAVSVSVNASQERQLDLALAREAREEAAEAASARRRRAGDQRPTRPCGQRRRPADQVRRALRARRGDPRADAVVATSRRPRSQGCPTVGSSGFDLWSNDEHLRGVHVDIPAHPGVTMLLAAPRSDLDGDARFLTRAMATVFGWRCCGRCWSRWSWSGG
jgi:hypothetical protein